MEDSVATAAEVVAPQEEEEVHVVDSVIEGDVVVVSVEVAVEPQEAVDSVVEVDVVVEEVPAVVQESVQELEY
jgi:hypothetical protein